MADKAPSEASTLPDSPFIRGDHEYRDTFSFYVRNFRDCIVTEMGKPDGNNGLGIMAQCVFETGKRMTRAGYDPVELGTFVMREMESAIPVAKGNTLIYLQQVKQQIQEAIGPETKAVS